MALEVDAEGKGFSKIDKEKKGFLDRALKC